ncbi:unnamed protein product [Bemisia tabaci]|uniref:Uncharacterized protein n=1 Tax=Bemisia tabaci TaxID=7038 RepID=A0A9P0F4Y9_BEMTA|nr:unnamed protein product [Bemisia tabaci]
MGWSGDRLAPSIPGGGDCHFYYLAHSHTAGLRAPTFCRNRATPSAHPAELITASEFTVRLNLSSDQHYLHDISRAECAPDLASRNTGAMRLASWLTTANRALRLYIATENPSGRLKSL